MNCAENAFKEKLRTKFGAIGRNFRALADIPILFYQLFYGGGGKW